MIYVSKTIENVYSTQPERDAVIQKNTIFIF